MKSLNKIPQVELLDDEIYFRVPLQGLIDRIDEQFEKGTKDLYLVFSNAVESGGWMTNGSLGCIAGKPIDVVSASKYVGRIQWGGDHPSKMIYLTRKDLD
ncbi:hypothetical protein HN832_00075 [archaeon]|jgi:hypothetical protein|nr:hypothetical protein [archaeon]MBT4373640.1 hypothetical protein [archaeon]MBT4531694.1 hypothetical protein [archaeon]MBT7001806.1 hypothetical protein [archaeon]MBT7281791.1 hypothetical protein [archaeon]